jgi:hypothetical protein
MCLTCVARACEQAAARASPAAAAATTTTARFSASPGSAVSAGARAPAATQRDASGVSVCVYLCVCTRLSGGQVAQSNDVAARAQAPWQPHCARSSLPQRRRLRRSRGRDDEGARMSSRGVATALVAGTGIVAPRGWQLLGCACEMHCGCMGARTEEIACICASIPAVA